MKELFKLLGYSIIGAIAVSVWYTYETAVVNYTSSSSPSTNVSNDIIEAKKYWLQGDCDLVFLNDNGRHIDIIIPDENYDKYIAYGWGSEEFYLNVPTWDDLTYRNIYNATKKNNKTLMHVKIYNEVDPNWAVTETSRTQIDMLRENVAEWFEYDKDGNKIFVSDGYHGYDKFYKAKGSYSYNYTCNTWANEMLKNSDLRARNWTVFSKEIIQLYK